MKSIKLILIIVIGMIAFLNVSCSNESGQKENLTINKDGDKGDASSTKEVSALIDSMIPGLQVPETGLLIENYTNYSISQAKINCIKFTRGAQGGINATGCATYKGVKYSFVYIGQYTVGSNGAIVPSVTFLTEASSCNC